MLPKTTVVTKEKILGIFKESFFFFFMRENLEYKSVILLSGGLSHRPEMLTV